MKEVDSELSFRHWLKGAKSGERIMYYDGFLMRDREVAMRSGYFSQDQYPQKIKCAIAAWKAFLDGAVRLTQRKRGQYEYEYIAIKR